MAAWTRSAKTDRTIDASESEVREKFWRTAKRAARHKQQTGNGCP